MPYKPVPYWAKLPHPMCFKEATSVAVDSQDRVYVFNRGNWPVMIFDADGNFLETWGEGEFVRPHGIFIDGEDNLYMADDDGHFVDKRTASGELIFRLGEKGKACRLAGGRSHSTDQPISSSIRKAGTSSYPMDTVTQECTSSMQTAITSSRGVSRGGWMVSSACRTTSACWAATRSLSQIERISASKSSVWTATI